MKFDQADMPASQRGNLAHRRNVGGMQNDGQLVLLEENYRWRRQDEKTAHGNG